MKFELQLSQSGILENSRIKFYFPKLWLHLSQLLAPAANSNYAIPVWKATTGSTKFCGGIDAAMGWLWGKSSNGFGASTTAEEATEGIDASGLTAVVTGAFKGIGVHTARTLAKRGAHVIMAGRNLTDGAAARQGILNDIPEAKVEVMELDLASFDSVRAFAKEYSRKDLPLNILINNAGVMGNPFTLSKDGIELQFATNHLGHFLLTNLLLDNLKTTAQSSGVEGRIVNVSSMAHAWTYSGGIRWGKLNEEKGYQAMKAYGQSKVANICHAKELARRLKEEKANVTANSLHPGGISTDLQRHMNVLGAAMRLVGLFMKTVPQGAATACYVALHPNVKGVSGEYFNNCNIAQPSSNAMNSEIAKRLWDVSVEMTSK
ncbi:hypothetical protein R1flu_029100 [Riccia fluitans]|uniref:Short-chain dehydrogenase TIC 32, chloroplastic n=1 Tax=Riccia fluitans TaxID=41844 RepID=A0ABD1XNN2_9MARC